MEIFRAQPSPRAVGTPEPQAAIHSGDSLRWSRESGYRHFEVPHISKGSISLCLSLLLYLFIYTHMPYTYICIHVCVYTCICIRECMYARMYACMYVHMSLCMYTCVYIYLRKCICMSSYCIPMYTNLYIRIYTYIYMYIYTYVRTHKHKVRISVSENWGSTLGAVLRVFVSERMEIVVFQTHSEGFFLKSATLVFR